MAVFQELKRSIAISPTDWDLLQELNVTLKPFLTATEFLSGQNYVSISGVAPVVCNLIAKLTKMNHQQESATALTADDSDLNQQPPDRLADFRVKIISQLSSRWDFKSNPGNGFLIAAALDPRFRSLKFLEKIEGSCSKFDVRAAISSMVLQMEIGRADDNVNVNLAAAVGASGGIRSSRGRIRRDNEKAKAMNDLFDDDEDNDAETPEDVVANEIAQYFGEKDVDRDVNIMQWWAVNEHRFKLLTRLARQYVVVTATSTPCERLFSEAGAIADRKRATMSPEHVDMLTCLHHNLSSFGVSTTTTEGMDLVD